MRILLLRLLLSWWLIPLFWTGGFLIWWLLFGSDEAIECSRDLTRVLWYGDKK